MGIFTRGRGLEYLFSGEISPNCLCFQNFLKFFIFFHFKTCETAIPVYTVTVNERFFIR